MKIIPIYCSYSFEWKGNHGSTEESRLMKVGTTDVPKDWHGIAIKSHNTGKVLLFDPVEDPGENGYDGEFMIYSHNDKYFVQIWNY